MWVLFELTFCFSDRFRRYLNLKAYSSFEDWNPDKETARAAELLYGHIENLELYPGLMAECTKPAMPGSGVCPGHTTGRGILDDAVALVRGDRFLSYDFNSTTLTNWGFAKIASSAPPGAYGGMMAHLLFSALPGAWTGTSSYALLPFYTPPAVKGILKGNKVIEMYDMVGASILIGCAFADVRFRNVQGVIWKSLGYTLKKAAKRSSRIVKHSGSCTRKQFAIVREATTP